MRIVRFVAAVALFTPALFSVGACSKSDSAQTGSGTASATPADKAAPSASVIASAAMPAASASAEPAVASATATAAASGSGASRTATAPTGSASGGAAAPSASAAAAACGTKPLPDCPLQAWMKSNTNPAVMRSDLPALATALDKIVTFAPPGYTNWASIAKDGAAAAKAGDLAGAKAACRSCHDQYKQKYKTSDIRGRKI